jgi:MFS family permease
VPAGRIVDRFGARRASAAGLAAMALGCLALALVPATVGVAGYVAPIATVTAGYALFQAANNAAVMAGAGADQRGLISGLLNLSRNLGLITGASAMGAVFASAAGTADVASATAGAVTSGMQVTFGVAAGLIMTALVVMAGGHRLRVPTQLEGRPGESD